MCLRPLGGKVSQALLGYGCQLLMFIMEKDQDPQ
jgi:hypothetical protein